MPEDGELAVHGRGCHRPPEPRRLRNAISVVLRDPRSGDLGRRLLGTEVAFELLADLLVLADRALSFRTLVVEVLSNKLGERLWFRRRRRPIPFEQPLRQRLLSVLPRPRSVVTPLLLPVHLEAIAPSEPADLMSCRGAATPRSFYDRTHSFLLSVRSS